MGSRLKSLLRSADASARPPPKDGGRHARSQSNGSPSSVMVPVGHGSDSGSDTSVPCSPLSPPPEEPSAEPWMELADTLLHEHTSGAADGPTRSSNRSANNPRKRSFYMMGVFFLCAFFGGSVLFGHSPLNSVGQFGDSSPQSQLAAAPLVSTSRHTGRRHLLSITENSTGAFGALQHAVGDQTSENSKALALWKDVIGLHHELPDTAAHAGGTSGLGAKSDPAESVGAKRVPSGTPPPRNSSLQISGNGLDELLLAVTQWRRHVALPDAGERVRPTAPAGRFRGANANPAATLAVVPYSARMRSDLYRRAMTSLEQLHTYVHHRMEATADHVGATAANSSNMSLLLCPRLYGRVKTQSPADAGGLTNGQNSLVLLLPSSSVQLGQGDPAVNKSAMPEWDGKWVEVDATITSIRGVPIAATTSDAVTFESTTHVIA